MALTGIGYGASLASVRALGSTVDGARVAIQKETNSAGRVAVEEWWVNRPAGLEQGFTVTERPDMGAPGEPLRMTLAVTTNLTARALPDETGLEFVDGAGRQALRYDHLVVLDALGRTLPARMRLADGVLTLEADDAGATYPLTIDPTFTQQAYLKPSNTGAGDQFGLSVAVSGDTVVVGAAGEDSSATGVDGSESNDSAPGAGAAYVFVRHGVTWRQQAYLKASNAEAGDSFGGSIAISGDTVVVGAMSERSNASGVNGNQSDNTGVGSGAAYVFVRNGTTWVQQAYLKASNPNAYDSFGRSVAVAGDTVVVGAAGEDSSGMGVNADQSDNGASSAGAAYVFVRDGVTWSQQAYLKASNTGRSDGFGSSLAVAGDTVVVGATGEASGATGVNGTQSDNSAVYAGAAYVFVRNGVTWSQQAYLKASNTDALDRFGRSVAVAGDTVAVGAYLEGSGATGVNGTQSDNSAYRAGAAYVFVRSGTTWSQQAYLKASNTGSGNPNSTTGTGDFFGSSIAASGNTVVVGAYGEPSNATGVDGAQGDNSAVEAGAAYVFVRSGAAWSQRAYLKASNTRAEARFGESVAVSGDIVAAGSHYEDSSATGVNGAQNDNSSADAGAAYVFAIPAAGDSVLDTGFNPGANGAVRALALQADGKILVGGDFTTLGGGGTGTGARHHIGRLNADGSLDTSFNSGANGSVLALAVQADGKILVGGTFTTLGPGGGGTGASGRNRIGRLNSDGSLDTNFNPGANGSVFALAVQTDGQILVGGAFTTLGASRPSEADHIGRLNPDGSYETGFSGGADRDVYALAVQSDGKILIGGAFRGLTYGGSSMGVPVVGRLLADGRVDNSFWPGADGTVRSLAVQADGKIMVGGMFTMLGGGAIGTTPRSSIGRLNSNGSLDASFHPGVEDGWVEALTLQADGKALVGGLFTGLSSSLGTTPRSNVGRFNPDGSLDPSFDPGTNGFVYALLVQPDGQILVGGDFTTLGGGGIGTTTRHRIGRLTPGSLVATFPLRVTVSGTGQGVVNSIPPGITNCATDCAALFASGAQVTLTATPNSGSSFTGWSGACSGGSATCTATLSQTTNVGAVFANVVTPPPVPRLELTANDLVLQRLERATIEFQIKNTGPGGAAGITFSVNQADGLENVELWAVSSGSFPEVQSADRRRLRLPYVLPSGGQVTVRLRIKAGSTGPTVVTGYVECGTGSTGCTAATQTSRVAVLPPSVAPPSGFTIVGTLDPTKDTIVLTHGLSKKDELTKLSELWTSSRTEETTRRPIGATAYLLWGASPAVLPSDVNIVQYVWKDAFQVGFGWPVRHEYVEGKNHAVPAGMRLAKKLLEVLTPGYDKRIHFIGHSLGTVVNATAAAYFLKNTPQVRTAQITVLDRPDRVGVIPDQAVGAASYPEDDDQFSRTYGFPKDYLVRTLEGILGTSRPALNLVVDNYYANPSVDSYSGVGELACGSATIPIHNRALTDPAFTVLQVGDDPVWSNDHSGVHYWYRWTINPNARGTTWCSGTTWNVDRTGKGWSYDTLNPCGVGWWSSIFGPGMGVFPEKAMSRGQECTGGTSGTWATGGRTSDRVAAPAVTESPVALGELVDLSGCLKSSPDAVTCAEGTPSRAQVQVDVPLGTGYLQFEYELKGSSDSAYAVVSLDEVPVFVATNDSTIGNGFVTSPPLPVPARGGRRTLTLAFYGTAGGAGSFSVRNVLATPGLPFVRYLAEGADGSFFEQRIALVNVEDVVVPARLTFQKTDGTVLTHSVDVGPRSRATVLAKDVPGLSPGEFSTLIESPLPLTVDRTLSWDVGHGYGAHAETAVEAPALTWYLAEGATHSGFNLFYLLQNPNAAEAQVRVRFLRPTGAPLEKTYALPPNSRNNIWVNQEDFSGLGKALAATDVSAVLESTNNQPIIVERALYLDLPGQMFGAGHESAGVTAPATQWFLAEGATGPYFDLFVLIANPGNADAHVEATFLLPDGTVVTKPYLVAANSRFNIWVDGEDPRLSNTAVSTTIRSTNSVPVIVERALWWPGSYGQWYEAHNSPGATSTGTKWALAEGEVGGTRGMETYILLANTSSATGSVKVTLLFEDGTSAERTFSVAANSRFNVDARAEFPTALDRRFGVVVEALGDSPSQIVVERAIYWGALGQHWAAGTNALATRLQ